MISESKLRNTLRRIIKEEIGEDNRTLIEDYMGEITEKFEGIERLLSSENLSQKEMDNVKLTFKNFTESITNVLKPQ